MLVSALTWAVTRPQCLLGDISFCALITVIHPLSLHKCFCFPALSQSLPGASPHRPREAGARQGGLLPGLCSCFANTQEALPESVPHKVSARPIWRSAGRGEPNGVLRFVVLCGA